MSAPEPIFRLPTIVVTVEREMRCDIDRILADPDLRKAIEQDLAEGRELDDSLRETFDEMCGTWADRDHIDGQYIWLEDQTATIDFGWATIVKRAAEILGVEA